MKIRPLYNNLNDMKKLLLFFIMLSLLVYIFYPSIPVYAGQIMDESNDGDSESNYSEPAIDSDGQSDVGYSGEYESSAGQTKKTNDVIKESAQGALNSLIEETIKAIGNSVAKGISESSNNSNNPNSEQDVDLNSHDSASQNDNQVQDSPRRSRKRITDY